MPSNGALNTICLAMGRKKQFVKTKEALERAEIAEYLRSLARQVEEGEVHFDEADEPVRMTLPALLPTSLSGQCCPLR